MANIVKLFKSVHDESKKDMTIHKINVFVLIMINFINLIILYYLHMNNILIRPQYIIQSIILLIWAGFNVYALRERVKETKALFKIYSDAIRGGIKDENKRRD